MLKERIREIDFLRFLAAIAVVLFHYAFRGYAADNLSNVPYPELSPFMKYGYLGIELFFMISGFVILMSASSGSLKKFIVSRISRLYPAFWVCCTATFLVSLLIGGEQYNPTFSQYLANMTMLSGFSRIPSIDGVYWSLFVEIRFYALVSLLLLIGQIKRAELFLSLWLLATFMLDIFPIGKLRILLLVEYSPYFIAGATFFLIRAQGITPKKMAIIIGSWGLAMHHSLLEINSLEQHYNTSFNRNIVTITISIFFVIMLLVATGRSGSFKTKDWATLGAISYPLYLLHQNIGFMIFNFVYPAIHPTVILIGVTILMLIASYYVNVAIEQRYTPQLKTLLDHTMHSGNTLLTGMRHRIVKVVRR